MNHISNLPMRENPSGEKTIGDFFKRLFLELWSDGGFDGKRPFGYSGWRTDVLIALGDAGLIDMVEDHYGLQEIDRGTGYKIISEFLIDINQH